MAHRIGTEKRPIRNRGFASVLDREVTTDLGRQDHEHLCHNNAESGEKNTRAALADGQSLHNEGKDSAIGQMEEEAKDQKGQEDRIPNDGQRRVGVGRCRRHISSAFLTKPKFERGHGLVFLFVLRRRSTIGSRRSVRGAVAAGTGGGGNTFGLLLGVGFQRQPTGGIVVNVLGPDLGQEKQDSGQCDWTDNEEEANVGIQEERQEGSRQDDDGRSEVVHHLVHGHRGSHADGTDNALRDGVQAGRNHGRHCTLNKLDQDHEGQILAVLLGEQRRGQGQERRGDGGRAQPHDLLVAVIHDVPGRSLGEELRHAKDEEHDTGLLFRVVL